MTQLEFFCHYQELQEDNPHGTAWLFQIPREQWTLAWDEGKRWAHMTTNLAVTKLGARKNLKISNHSLGQSHMWEIITILLTVGLILIQWSPPDKFTHLLQPNSSPKKKLSPTLTSFNSLTAKDFNFKLRKEWIWERGIEWGNSLSSWIKERVIVGNQYRLFAIC